MKLINKTAIVTGAAGGIGLATALHLAEEGARVMLTDINQDKLQKAKSGAAPGLQNNIQIRACDVSMEDDVIKTIDETIDIFGHLDIVVNNAGLMIFKPLEDQTAADWTRILGVDLLGAFFFIKHAFISMKHGGSIVNISSIHAIETTPMVATYAAAKAALLSLTRSASIEGKQKGIRVNAVLPGAVDTAMLWENPNIKSGVEKIDPAAVGKPEDIAAAIAFLASEEAAYVNGASLRVDGGRLNRL
jgi:NAD(P)-dependent dehydrogenase (short-subunit alcohol dehydrogenase family)